MPSVKKKTITKRWNNNNTSRAYVVFNSQQQMYLSSSPIWSWEIEKSAATFFVRPNSLSTNHSNGTCTCKLERKAFPPATSFQNHFLLPIQLHVIGSVICLSFQGRCLKKDYLNDMPRDSIRRLTRISHEHFKWCEWCLFVFSVWRTW